MKLSPRLKTIAQLVPRDTITADIGTDHGYIPVYLIENKICKKAIAADINYGPLKNAEKTISKYSFTEQIETRLGNGLEPIKPGEVNCVIIAGMGGILINEILYNSKDVVDSIDYLVLQPMNAQDELRKWLYNNNFKIANEKLAKEGDKIYEIILAMHGSMSVEDEIYFEVGADLIRNKDPLLGEFIALKIKKYIKIYNMVKNEDSEKASEKRTEIENKIFKLQEVLKCL